MMLKGEFEDVTGHQSWILLECCHCLCPLLPGKSETVLGAGILVIKTSRIVVIDKETSGQ